ncbi:hypothetical protein ACQP2F_07860 [Actinoplanes sp. CA-030573]|uniref:hypothetical protein n=1 Tax=Actinoplanes sp. CA-030573 TaxID=3239898 RepID=UPI003D8D8229
MTTEPHVPVPQQGAGVYPPAWETPPVSAGYGPPPAWAPAASGPPVPEEPPAPPPGPGVYPPFPAPPVEGKGKRIGLSIGIAAGVVLLVCGGGLAAIIGVAVSSQGSYQEKAHAAVSGYLNALRDGRYDAAYGMLCDETQQGESPAAFRSKVTAEPAIRSYTMGKFDLVSWSVPVDAVYDNGDSAKLEAYLGVDSGTGAFEVCELGE